MIVIKDLVKTFQSGNTELTVLKSLSFEIPQGQFVAITGRSGSGKSTLLYQMSALDNSTSGSVIIDSVNVTELDQEHKVLFRLHNLGYIFQDYALLPSLTAAENVMTPLLMQGKSFEEAQNLAYGALEKVGLKGKEENLPSMLSGGQQQRASVARAIVGSPKILFADEPTANLDTESSKTVLDLFLQLHAEGQAVIMVTHEVEYARLAEREIVLSDGVITRDQLRKKSKHTLI
jgi:putative ABC transport system ATP-binding protein